jgi:hypothetical protein
MSERILGAVAAAAAVAAVLFVIHVLARRSVPAVDGAPIRGADRTEHEPAGGSRDHAPLPDPTAWYSVVAHDLSVAEGLLDWAEGEGYQERELVVLGNAAFLVRWRNRA